MSSNEVAGQVRRRTGGRSARVRDAVLQAALQAMAEHGLGGVSISEIARGAGVHASSIQRRWGTRENVMLDALLTYSQEKLPIPDTGALRGDLVAFGRSIAGYLATPLGEAVAQTMAATDDDPALAAGRTRAVDRDEVSADTDPELALELLVAPLHFRRLLTRETVDDDFVERLVDALMRGLAS
jgi:AcrR family transcriptional regulator